MTTDLDDETLMALMAELEAQNAELAANAESANVVLADESQNEPIEVEEPTTQEPLEPEISKVDVEPTKEDIFNAEQQVELEAAFEKPTEVATDDIDAYMEKVKAVKAEPLELPEVEISEDAKVEVDKLPDIEAEPLEPLTPEIRELKLEVELTDKKPMSEKAIAEMVQLKYKPDVMAFNRDTKIDEANLNQCVIEQSSLLAYYTHKYAEAKAQYERTKHKFNQLEAGLYGAHKLRLQMTEERVTEKAIEVSVRMDEKWVKNYNFVIEAEMYANTYKGFVDAIKDRGSMLIGLCSDRRKEAEGQLRIMQSSHYEQRAKDEHASMAQRALDAAKSALNR